MAKKRTRKKYISKGRHSTVTAGLTQAVRAERDHFDKLTFKANAWKKLQNPWLTVQNPNKSETNRPFIKVRANEWWGDPRASYIKTLPTEGAQA